MAHTLQLPIIFKTACDTLVPILAGGEFAEDGVNTSTLYTVIPKSAFEYVEVKQTSDSVTILFGDNSIEMRSDGKGFHSFMNDGIRESAGAISFNTIDAMIEHAGSIKWT